MNIGADKSIELIRAVDPEAQVAELDYTHPMARSHLVGSFIAANHLVGEQRRLTILPNINPLDGDGLWRTLRSASNVDYETVLGAIGDYEPMMDPSIARSVFGGLRTGHFRVFGRLFGQMMDSVEVFNPLLRDVYSRELLMNESKEARTDEVIFFDNESAVIKWLAFRYRDEGHAFRQDLEGVVGERRARELLEQASQDLADHENSSVAVRNQGLDAWVSKGNKVQKQARKHMLNAIFRRLMSDEERTALIEGGSCRYMELVRCDGEIDAVAAVVRHKGKARGHSRFVITGQTVRSAGRYERPAYTYRTQRSPNKRYAYHQDYPMRVVGEAPTEVYPIMSWNVTEDGLDYVPATIMPAGDRDFVLDASLGAAYLAGVERDVSRSWGARTDFYEIIKGRMATNDVGVVQVPMLAMMGMQELVKLDGLVARSKEAVELV